MSEMKSFDLVIVASAQGGVLPPFGTVLTHDGIRAAVHLRGELRKMWPTQKDCPPVISLHSNPTVVATAEVIAADSGVFPWSYDGSLPPPQQIIAHRQSRGINQVHLADTEGGLIEVLKTVGRIADERNDQGMVLVVDRSPIRDLTSSVFNNDFNVLNLIFRDAKRGLGREGKSVCINPTSSAGVEYARYTMRAPSWQATVVDGVFPAATLAEVSYGVRYQPFGQEL